MSVYLPASLETLQKRIAFATVDTWTPKTQEEIREAIEANDLAGVVCCSRSDKSGCLTYAQAYAAVFGVDIDGTRVRRRPTETQRQAKGV